ncbi:unnamed protein product [Arabidopsis halleri]
MEHSLEDGSVSKCLLLLSSPCELFSSAGAEFSGWLSVAVMKLFRCLVDVVLCCLWLLKPRPLWSLSVTQVFRALLPSASI